VAERFVVPRKPGNSGGGKGPQFKTDAGHGEGHGDWAIYQLHMMFRAADGVARERPREVLSESRIACPGLRALGEPSRVARGETADHRPGKR
jgi:hypothetical protein